MPGIKEIHVTELTDFRISNIRIYILWFMCRIFPGSYKISTSVIIKNEKSYLVLSNSYSP